MIHCDYIKFQTLKKALKSSQDNEQKEELSVKEPLVVFTAIEKEDSESTIKEMLDSVKKNMSDVKAKKIVLYPYAHLSSNLSSPDKALEYLKKIESELKKYFEVVRAPFGYYKSFELKCKGHPLSELSKEFSNKESKQEIKEQESSPEQLLKELSRTKLDTSKLKENDHRIIGQKLDLFSFHESSPGAVFWHNNGLILYNELIRFWREIHNKESYQEISTPQILDNRIWKISGHWDLYRENMFLTSYDKRDFGVKPMNCPGAMLVYKSRSRSYKELPLRLAELGTVHRQELSGVLSGLFRVIKFTQDDAHIFCAEEQLENEITRVIKLFKDILYKFNFKDFRFTISVRSKEKKDKYLGDDKLWKKSEESLANALKKLKIKFDIEEGEAKFYGPSLDVQIKDSLGREWQCATIQLDMQLPLRFGLTYTGKDNKEHTPLLLHRVIFGSIERFIGVLLEHLNGNLPLWLSPIQVRVINFTDKNSSSSEKLILELKKELSDLRIDSDLRSTTINEKIHDAEIQKIPYIIVIGNKEEESNTLAVRKHSEKPKFGVKFLDLVKEIKEKTDKRI